MNVTAIQGSTRSFLTLYPADAALPNASNLSWNGGDPPTPTKSTPNSPPTAPSRSPTRSEPGPSVQINLDLMPGAGSTAPCTVDLNVTSGDTFLTRPGAIRGSLIRNPRTLDVSLDGSVPVRSYVSFLGANGFQPGDSLAFTISRDHDSANDSCAGQVVVTGMSLTPSSD